MAELLKNISLFTRDDTFAFPVNLAGKFYFDT